MPENHEIFLRHIEEIFGTAGLIKKHDCPRGGGPVSVFIYRNIPESGMVTGVTYGLSRYPHPDWKLSRPEMIISVESGDDMWIVPLSLHPASSNVRTLAGFLWKPNLANCRAWRTKCLSR